MSTFKFMDCNVPGSYADRTRKERLRWLDYFFSFHNTILDVGGTPSFWESLHIGGIDIINIKSYPGCKVGDGRKLPYEDKSYDLVVSFSTIEHVGTLEDQIQFASEIMRVGKGCLVQTPYKYFPFDVHYQIPFFNFLPYKLQYAILKTIPIGYYGIKENIEMHQSLRLLSRKDLKNLFPSGLIMEDKICGLTQSIMVMA